MFLIPIPQICLFTTVVIKMHVEREIYSLKINLSLLPGGQIM